MTANPTLDSKPLNLKSAADLSTYLFRFGKLTSTGINLCTVAGEKSDGVIGAYYTHVPAAGDAIDFYTSRMPLIEAGGIVAAGVDITTDTTGRAVTAGAGDVVNGRSVDASTAAGQYIRMMPPFAKPNAQTVVDAALSPTTTLAGSLVVYSLAIPDYATQTLSFVNAEKIEIVDVVVNKNGAGAANTIKVQDASSADISDAIAAAVDKAVTRAGTLDPAKSTVAAGAGFQIVATRAAGTMAAQVLIYAVKRA